MGAGALYDFIFAVAILFFSGPAARLMGLEPPTELIFFRMNGILLILLAGIYSLATLAPERYQAVVRVAAAGRFLGFLYLGGVYATGNPVAFFWLALGDLFFCILHVLLLRSARRIN